MLLLTSRDKPDEVIAEGVDAFKPSASQDSANAACSKTSSLQTCSENESPTDVKEVDIKGL